MATVGRLEQATVRVVGAGGRYAVLTALAVAAFGLLEAASAHAAGTP